MGEKIKSMRGTCRFVPKERCVPFSRPKEIRRMSVDVPEFGMR